MKTDLPQRAEYYRPARARELRERAALLRCTRLPAALAAAASGNSAAALLACWLCLPAIEKLGEAALLVALLIGAGLVSAPFLVAGCVVRRAGACLAGAAALEAEHAARYGSLADEVI